ncbi:hypothetical protein D0962_04285 [Leptolyngbyaceae cyanobacterium CCMR0082]|uniref:Uncharacterized protein n=1 Tax=Adonisia turfae CCMR0082 TaxID=2304604 RepID=A0A6M0S0J5_9CYAN|nr:hypothetical protein [Adonisia turfae]NEZ61999.1 hypothetical protein [Adonisia turfae CCMR0082]
MPKAIDSTVWSAVKSAYLNRNEKPRLKDLSREFGVSTGAISTRRKGENWDKLRDDAQANIRAERIQSARKAFVNAGQNLDDLTILEATIADMYFEMSATVANSKEGCANAVTSLIKAKRELFPPTALELARMAVQLGIKHEDFLEALKELWEQELEPVETLANKK